MGEGEAQTTAQQPAAHLAGRVGPGVGQGGLGTASVGKGPGGAQETGTPAIRRLPPAPHLGSPFPVSPCTQSTDTSRGKQQRA
jgi:hypothetical protein